MKVAGESFHIGGYELNPVRLQTADGFDIDDDASYTLFDLDYDVFGVHLEAHIHRVPPLRWQRTGGGSGSAIFLSS